jgi:hypothetical protein
MDSLYSLCVTIGAGAAKLQAVKKGSGRMVAIMAA